MSRVLHLGWQQFEAAVDAAIRDISASPFLSGKPSGVYGIPRGGLVIAVALSHRLAVPLLTDPEPNCVIVDDVIESGRTMQAVLDSFFAKGGKGLDVHTWVWVSKNARLRSGYGSYIDPAMWVCFPWEDWKKAELDRREYEERNKRSS